MSTAKINLNNMFNGMVAKHWLPKTENEGYTTSIESVPDIKFATDMFISMVGGKYDFYGICHDAIKLNDMVFQILEDPDDGYRSYLGATRIADSENQYTFFSAPIAKIKIETTSKISQNELIPEGFRGYIITDCDDNHIWGLIGTGNTDDYYPYVVLDYRPKKPGKI